MAGGCVIAFTHFEMAYYRKEVGTTTGLSCNLTHLLLWNKVLCATEGPLLSVTNSTVHVGLRRYFLLTELQPEALLLEEQWT
jgi:hypothetical protein